MRPYHSPDFGLAIVTIIIVVVGLGMVASASVVESFTATGSNYFYFLRQLIFAAIGLASWLLVQKIPYRRWEKWATPLLYLALGLLVVVLIPGIGHQIGGARRWINFGLFTLQVSEIVKLALVIYLATWFAKETRHLGDFQKVVLPFLALMGMVGILIVFQPDLGTLGIIVLVMLSIYWVAGAAIRHVAFLSGLGLLAFWLLIRLAPYRLSRILTFLDPSRDPLGVGYHINQALLAIGSGGLFGLGFGYSRQKYNYLPTASSDSIFAIIGEELGFLRTILLILLYGYIILRGIRIAQNAPDNFSRLLATGITAWIGWQAVVNMGAITGLLPLTGVPLPFISQGGTSLVVSLIAIGLLLNISKYTTGGEKKESSFSRRWHRWTRPAALSSRR